MTELADITRGYHRAISDLTEAVAPTNKSVAKSVDETTPAPAASTEENETNNDVAEPPNIQNSATEMTLEDESADDKKKEFSSGASISSGHWNSVEVQEDPTKTDDDANNRTVVFVDEANGETIKEVDEQEDEEVPEPPLVEEEATKSDPGTQALSKSELVKQNATSREDELLGPRKTFAEGYLVETLMRTFPIWGVVLILILTRVQPIGIKEYLTKIYGLPVKKVNTQQYLGKRKVIRGPRKTWYMKYADFKKAIVSFDRNVMTDVGKGMRIPELDEANRQAREENTLPPGA